MYNRGGYEPTTVPITSGWGAFLLHYEKTKETERKYGHIFKY
jgi:hypothetical protein